MKKLILALALVFSLSGMAYAECDILKRSQEFAETIQAVAQKNPEKMSLVQQDVMELNTMAQDLQQNFSQEKVDAICDKYEVILEKLK